MSRAADFLRMSGVSEVSIRLAGSHAGVEIGADGPSQMALEDLAVMRAVNGSTVLYPADATSAAALADRDGRLRGRLLPPDDPRRLSRHLRARRGPIGGAKVGARATPTR